MSPPPLDDPDEPATAAAVAGGVPSTDPAPDPWAPLRRHTPARIALGRAGTSLPTREVLGFAAAHAQARDAIHLPLDMDALEAALREDGWSCLQAESRAPTRESYLLRPDWGRRLSPDAADRLAAAAGGPIDLALVVADGLSSMAVQRHARALLAAIRGAIDPGWRLAPLVLARQSRVALGDEIGQLLGARLVAVLIGERPGLGSPDSVGIYVTFAPRVGCHDAQRNCISNVRPEGLPPAIAARRFGWLAREALRRQLTGVDLKDDSETGLLADGGNGGPARLDVHPA